MVVTMLDEYENLWNYEKEQTNWVPKEKQKWFTVQTMAMIEAFDFQSMHVCPTTEWTTNCKSISTVDFDAPSTFFSTIALASIKISFDEYIYGAYSGWWMLFSVHPIYWTVWWWHTHTHAHPSPQICTNTHRRHCVFPLWIWKRLVSRNILIEKVAEHRIIWVWICSQIKKKS